MTDESAVAKPSDARHEKALRFQVTPNSLYDLSAENTIHQLDETQDGIAVPIQVVCRRHEPALMKQTLSKIGFRFKDVGSGRVRMEPRDSSACEPFVDEVFVFMEGVDNEDGRAASADEQAAWISSNSWIKHHIFFQGLGAFQVMAPDEDERPGRFILTARDHEIRMRVFAYAWRQGQEVKLNLVHRLKRESAADYNAWTRATQGIERNRSGWIETESDYDLAEQLYDHLAIELDGACFRSDSSDANGDTPEWHTATEEHKDKWIGLVPAWWKAEIIQTIMRKTAGKNV